MLPDVGAIVEDPIDMKRGTLVATLPYIAKQYKVSFDVFIKKSKGTSWQSIVHFTIDENHGVPGRRHPALSLTPEGKLCTVSDVNGDHNYHFYLGSVFPEGKWIHIEVAQTLIDGKVILILFSITLTFAYL